MKQLLLLPLGLVLFLCTQAQPDSVYQQCIARAGLFHLQKDAGNAIPLFEKAFRLQPPDALNAYKAAGVYSLANDTAKGFYYLHLALTAGWTEADMLALDPYFDNLRKADPQKWKQAEAKAFAAEKQYEQGLKMPALRKQINGMTITDQRLRFARIQAVSKEEKRKLNRDIHLSDSANRVQAQSIIRRYGWPKMSAIGKDGQNNLWLIVQHADDDVLFQQTALAAMQQLKGTREINPENYAFLYDRVQCNLNYKQLYGTQVNWSEHGKASGFRSIAHEDGVDQRRKAIGLLPLRIYALTYGFEYNNITAAQARQREAAGRAYIQGLTDSAGYFYKNRDFQKVYDTYNTASMMQGGMNNAANYEAALLFARIAAQDTNNQYKSIALDFLNLLYQRHALSRKKLQSEPAFKILYKEPRWVAINSRL